MIKAENLVKYYGTHLALDHISFRIDGCGAVGLLGPNGAGKSTTMNILAGNLMPSAGTVTLDGCGRRVHGAAVGYLPEIPPLYPELTVREYLDYACGLKGLPKAERPGEAARVMEQIRLEHVADRLIRYLSKGYRQRVGIAQALIGNPAIIILDEPSIGLDPRQIIEIREIIRSLKASHTVLVSSHILSEIQAVCDRAIILCEGRVVADDTIQALTARGKDFESVFLALTGGGVPSFGGKEDGV